MDQGWGLLRQFPLFHYFPNFSPLSKYTLDFEYHVYLWQMSLQLSCNCQIWMWFKEKNWYICKIENFAYGVINEWSFGNPHPRLVSYWYLCCYIPSINCNWSSMCWNPINWPLTNVWFVNNPCAIFVKDTSIKGEAIEKKDCARFKFKTNYLDGIV